MPGRSDSGGGGSPTIVTTTSPPQKPLNLLMAVSEIQQWCAVEKTSTTEIDKNYLTTQQRVDFFAVGVKNSFTHFLFTLFLTPITVAVLHNLIHVFGDGRLTLFDEIYALLLAFSVSLGFGVFLSSLRSCYVGNITKGMIRNLFGGILLGEAAKDFVIAFIYMFIYYRLTPRGVADFILFLNRHFGVFLMKLHTDYIAVFHWIMKFREVLPVSVAFVFISSVLFAVVPFAIIMISSVLKRPGSEEL